MMNIEIPEECCLKDCRFFNAEYIGRNLTAEYCSLYEKRIILKDDEGNKPRFCKARKVVILDGSLEENEK